MRSFPVPKFVATCLLVGAFTCQALGDPLKVGDEFTYDSQVRRDGEFIASEIVRRLVSASEGELRFEVVTRAKGQSTSAVEVRNASMNLIEVGNLRFEPFLDLFRIPVDVGARRYSITRVQKDSGPVVTMEGEVTTGPLVPLTVPAGTYQVHLITAVGKFIDPSSGASSKYETRVWFDPSRIAIIKQEFHERNRDDTGYYMRGVQELVKVKQ